MWTGNSHKYENSRQWSKIGYRCHFGQRRKVGNRLLDFKSENELFSDSWGKAEYTRQEYFFCWATQKTMGHRGLGTFLSSAKVIMPRLPSWSRVSHLKILDRKGGGQMFFLSLLFYNNQLKIKILKGYFRVVKLWSSLCFSTINFQIDFSLYS